METLLIAFALITAASLGGLATVMLFWREERKQLQAAQKALDVAQSANHQWVKKIDELAGQVAAINMRVQAKMPK